MLYRLVNRRLDNAIILSLHRKKGAIPVSLYSKPPIVFYQEENLSQRAVMGSVYNTPRLELSLQQRYNYQRTSQLLHQYFSVENTESGRPLLEGVSQSTHMPMDPFTISDAC